MTEEQSVEQSRDLSECYYYCGQEPNSVWGYKKGLRVLRDIFQGEELIIATTRGMPDTHFAHCKFGLSEDKIFCDSLDKHVVTQHCEKSVPSVIPIVYQNTPLSLLNKNW